MAPIHTAAYYNQVAEVTQLLDEDPRRVREEKWDFLEGGCIPLHYAADGGSLEVARLLIERGSPIDAPGGDDADSTPLSGACRNAHPEMVALLLAHGADPNIYGCHAIVEAALGGSAACVRLLLQDGRCRVDYGSALWHVCREGHEETARVLLLEGGADPTIPVGYGPEATPLDIARQRGHQGCVKLLKVSQVGAQPYLSDIA